MPRPGIKPTPDAVVPLKLASHLTTCIKFHRYIYHSSDVGLGQLEVARVVFSVVLSRCVDGDKESGFMNAAEQALGLSMTSKIAAVVNLVKQGFPDMKVDLRPWANDPDTRELVDPDSIDLAFHLPGWSRRCQARSLLLQIRLFQDPLSQEQRAIGVEAVGLSFQGEQWRLSTIGNWQMTGKNLPQAEVQAQLRYICEEILVLFNSL
jgi:hypothetical protein